MVQLSFSTLFIYHFWAQDVFQKKAPSQRDMDALRSDLVRGQTIAPVRSAIRFFFFVMPVFPAVCPHFLVPSPVKKTVLLAAEVSSFLWDSLSGRSFIPKGFGS